MPQYTILDTAGTDAIELTDGTDSYRVQVRSTLLCFDVALTETGFPGVEDIDWANISETTLPSSEEEFRLGVRDAVWVIDQSITGGFTGIQNIDWGNVEEHSL